MTASDQRLEIETFEFVDRINAAATRDAVTATLFAGLGKFGFESFLIADLPPKGIPFENHIVLSGWPIEWFNQYMEMKYYDVDPIAARAREAVEPFYWSEAYRADDAGDDGRARLVMEEAREFNLNDGLVVPIFGSNGEQSCVTMGGRNQDHHPRARHALHFMSMYAHFRAREIAPIWPTLVKCQSDQVELTEREKECLRWIALGKTDLDLADILDISAHTANMHVRNAGRKLNAANRTQAVVTAMMAGQIKL